jgi:uncharacterized cupredoxin-like copper-binding protein
MKPKLLNFLLVAGLLLALAACSGQSAGPTVIHATLNEMTVVLDKTSVPAGPVTFEITNEGAIEHELVLELAGSDDLPFEAGGVESEAEHIQSGGTASFQWTLEPGEYQLSCHIPGHFEAGMYTYFTVTP